MKDSHVFPQWQSDGMGSTGRIGVLTPDFDPVPESEMSAMAPPGISIHASRVPYASLPPGDRARTFAEPPRIDTAVELLAGLTPNVIVYAYTGTSYLLGAEADEALRARLEKRAGGIPVVLTASAASEALRLLRVRRLALRARNISPRAGSKWSIAHVWRRLARSRRYLRPRYMPGQRSTYPNTPKAF
jgi:maleate cis-trans isomerase